MKLGFWASGFEWDVIEIMVLEFTRFFLFLVRVLDFIVLSENEIE